MSESQNIEQSPEDGKSERPEEVHSNISPAECSNQTSEISKSDISTSDIPKWKYIITLMLKHERKPWKEYFLEYLMIVLAVTTGFFAESLREHLGDTSKEHAYITSLKKDLITDTINLGTWILAFNSRINEYDNRHQHTAPPRQTFADGSDLYYRARMTTRGTVFDDNNNTIAQFKYFRNQLLIAIRQRQKKLLPMRMILRTIKM